MLWPTQIEKKKKRTKRGMMGGGGHGMDFPSAETALMTVSILTFAVFLIKLVLVCISVVYIYNNYLSTTKMNKILQFRFISMNFRFAASDSHNQK